ncbi:MAG: hypothetical protein HY942_04095 [Gammaproteobacteria bacterium]|nr:hypothetical protein [Gammaproteobacteria bacterium]
MSLYLPLFKALNDAGVKYVVVGGFATVLHGYARLTMDVDLMVDLAPQEATRAMQTLESLGFEPRAPVPAAQFADAAKRKEWIEQKGMKVFSLHNPANPMLTVDVFVQHPIPFTDLRSRAERMVIDGVPVYICSIEDLITLKQLAGRPLDLLDIEKLRIIQEKRKRGER